MKKRSLLVLILTLVLILSGCQRDPESTGQAASDAARATETEPTVVYGWTSGESPVPDMRIGMVRASVSLVDHAVSPTGIYFIERSDSSSTSYILYADNGSDTFIKLCGRPDCTHVTPDCNAYVYNGSDITYKDGYLYVISGEGQFTESCKLIRMNPDGSNHVEHLDLVAFAKENGGDSVVCDRITDGFCLFSVYRWEETQGEQIGSSSLNAEHAGYYYYKLDGSMEEPVKANIAGLACYSCGDVFLTYLPVAQNGGQLGSYWNWDPDTNEATFLTDHPGEPGWFGPDQGFYYMDGAIHRLTYATNTDEIMVETGLEGDYYAFFFPDCVVVASDEKNSFDNNLYIYNWSFELLDTVEIYNPTSDRTQFMLIAETAERLILTNKFDGKPMYYINKSELGTGNVEIHSFVYD